MSSPLTDSERAAADAVDAARYRHMRNLAVTQTGQPGQPCIAMPNGMKSGYYLTEETADHAIDTAMQERDGSNLVDDGMCRSCLGSTCVTGPECVTLGRDTRAAPQAESDYKRMFGAAVASLAEISEALGIDEEEAACANGNKLILEAIARKNEALLAALKR